MAEERFWIEQTADAVEAFAATKPEMPETIVCASGISPSGAIHLGNLRELMTVHLVAEELRRRGRKVEHIYSWDDYDRFRKVPKGVPESWAEHIGKPLAAVPDPGGEFPSYADRHIRDFEQAAARLGVVSGKNVRYVRQSEAYPRGDYRAGIRTAMAKRSEIFDILARYQTANPQDRPLAERRAAYYPFKPYCATCGKDDAVVESYDEATATIAYRCACGHRESYSLDEKIQGKLVWKVDWPMRWAHEGVVFEPGGEDHAAPNSSYTVGKEIVKLFGYEAPYFVQYAFVGMAGRSKISSSAGGSPTPGQALEILEPAMLRWLYVRRHYGKHFDIDFGKEVIRLYDEWDSFGDKVAAGQASEAERLVRERCLATSAGAVLHAPVAVPFRTLSSAADVTLGNREQILRVASDQLGRELSEGETEPRLTCAIAWVTRYLPEDERTHVREGFAREAWEALAPDLQEQVRTLADRMGEAWTLEGLTTLLYGIPKEAAGQDPDDEPTPAVKAAQRDFFKALYRLLLTDSETGPRLPTFFLSLGESRVRALLGADIVK